MEIKNIVDDLYEFIEIYFILPKKLLNEEKPYLGMSEVDNNEDDWIYQILYDSMIDIYFCKDEIEIYIMSSSQETEKIITTNIKNFTNIKYTKNERLVYDIQLKKIPYFNINEIKDLLLKLA